MNDYVPGAQYGHFNCSLILPGEMRRVSFGQASPPWWAGRTHGCWCSSWRLTKNGFRIWRRGAYRKPKPGELRRVKERAR